MDREVRIYMDGSDIHIEYNRSAHPIGDIIEVVGDALLLLTICSRIPLIRVLYSLIKSFFHMKVLSRTSQRGYTRE